jgi:hypothetical protein
VIAAATVLAGTATAQATARTLDHEDQAVGTDTAQATSAEPGSEDPSSGSTTNLGKVPVCDVFCEPNPCFLDPWCDPCEANPSSPDCHPVPVPVPGPPNPPEPPASPSFTCTPSAAAVDDPPTAERPTKVVGIGTLRCSRAANMDLQTTLFFSGNNGGSWDQMSQAHTVLYDVPQNTAKQLTVEYACGGGIRNLGWWKVELNYKADNRSGSGFPAAVGPAVWTGTQYLYNISC